MNTQTHTPARARAALLAALAAGLIAPSLASAQPGTPAAPTAPSPPTPPAAALAPSAPGQPAASSSYSLSVNDDGRQIKLEMKNGVVTRAEVDGVAVPDDRIENDGDVVRIKDAQGVVIYEHELPGDFSWNGRGFAAISDPDVMVYRHLGQQGLPGAITINKLNGLSSLGLYEPEVSVTVGEPLEPPPVMLGVQMGVPDSTLAGHLGIQREKTTLLTAVHEGLPAASAGLAPYDLIVSLNGQDDANPHAIRTALKDRKAGDTLKLGVIHQGVRKDVTLTLEAYDREKLSAAKANRIAENEGNDFFAVAAAPEAPMPPLPPGLPEETRKEIEEYLKQHGTPRAWTINRFGGTRAPRAQTEAQQRMLADIERQQAEAQAMAEKAARQAEEIARRAGEIQRRSGSAAEMQERMERMEKMLQELMNQQMQPPGKPAEKDGGSRS